MTSLKKCRACLKTITEKMTVPLHNKIKYANKLCLVSEMLMECTAVHISQDDVLPQQICVRCVNTLFVSYKFKMMCEKSEQVLLGHHSQITSERKENKSDVIKNTEKHTLPRQTTNLSNNVKKIIKRINETKRVKIKRTIDPKPEEIKTEDISDDNNDNEDDDTTEPEKLPPTDLPEIVKKKIERLKRQKGKRSCHFKFHSGKCELCVAEFTQTAELRFHMKEAHDMVDRFICRYCRKNYYIKENMEWHMEHEHTEEEKRRPHLCPHCGKDFANAQNLKRHLFTHSKEKPFECQQCGKRFSQRPHLHSHLISHNGNPKHVCPVCGHKFLRSGSLTTHMRSHTGEKNYQCTVCGKRFSSNGLLKEHTLIHTGIKNFKCDFCGRCFTRKCQLVVHRKIHTGEKTKVCELCGASFIHAVSLRTHMKKHQ